jgi:hypothetical protein
VADFDPLPILRVLDRHEVRFVVVGGIAAIAQGSPLPTQDLDVTPARDPENLGRLASALEELEATLRVPHGPGVPFPIDADFLGRATAWTLDTKLGSFDLVVVPAGTTGYDDLDADAAEAELADGLVVRIASLRDVIRMKQASGRPKDLAALPALYRALELRRGRES